MPSFGAYTGGLSIRDVAFAKIFGTPGFMAHVLGEDGVSKRIDSFAMAIQMRCTIYDLEESELSYAPPFGSAKDPVNFAGMVAANVLRGDMPLSHCPSTLALSTPHHPPNGLPGAGSFAALRTMSSVMFC